MCINMVLFTINSFLLVLYCTALNIAMYYVMFSKKIDGLDPVGMEKW